MAVDLEANRDSILDHERRLSRMVAGEVVDKPILAMWMILIPIFFVFYYFQLKRYRNGLKDFAGNFLVTRQRTIDKIYEAEVSGGAVDIDSVVAISDIPSEAMENYRIWVETLAEYYRSLITRNGFDYDDLVKAAYPRKSGYLAALDTLNRVESEFNATLAPLLPGDADSIDAVVTAMQQSVEKNRRLLATEIYA